MASFALGEMTARIFLILSTVSRAGIYFSLQCGQSFLTSRWAITAFKAAGMSDGKRISPWFRGLSLGDSLDLVFDRILNGDYFYLGRVESVNDGIERRRFSGTGRAGVQDHPVWVSHFLAELVIGESAQPQIVEVQGYRFLIEEAHHDILPEI